MKTKGFFALLLILFLGLVLRFHNHLTWPREGATFDEYAWTWLGMNIIQKHVPISWSPHPQYKTRTHYVSPKGTPYWLVEPYLEHPPLFGLIAGTYALASGAKDMYSLEIAHIRGLALILGLASIIMVYSLSYELYDHKTALFATVLFATIPTIVIGSRIVQNENFFIPGFLFILYSLIRYLKNKNKKFFYWSAVTAGLLTLAKVPWWGATLSSILILFCHRRYKDAVIFLSIVFVFFSVFILWGLYWDFELFQNLWKLQLNRYDITFDGIFSLFTSPTLIDRSFLDGWIVVGWIAFFTLLTDMKKHTAIILGLLGYFAIYILGIPNEPGHGWYRYPFYPFLIIAFSYVFLDSIKKHSLFVFFALSFIGVSLLQHTWKPTFGFSYGVYRMFLLSCGLTGLRVFFSGKWTERISKISTIGIFAMLLLLNIWTVLIYNEQ